jgi:hypothetical protein
MLCLHICRQCCGSETFHYASGSDFSMSSGSRSVSGSGSYFQKVPVSDPTFFLTKYDFKGPKIASQNIIFKGYLNLIYKNGQNYEITPFLMVFVNVHIHFQIWTLIWIHNTVCRNHSCLSPEATDFEINPHNLSKLRHLFWKRWRRLDHHRTNIKIKIKI